MEESQRRGVQVDAVHLKLGALSGVVKEALLFSYEIACQDTPLEGTRLIVEDVPVVVFCSRCEQRQTLASMQSFVCPECGAPAGEVLHGREIEVFALEVRSEVAAKSS
jgi:hydrogenase nickel incorporation protein HypA/HybF